MFVCEYQREKDARYIKIVLAKYISNRAVFMKFTPDVGNNPSNFQMFMHYALSSIGKKKEYIMLSYLLLFSQFQL